MPYTGVESTGVVVLAPAAGQAPGVNTAAVAILTGTVNLGWMLTQVDWSYNAVLPTAGALIISWIDPVAGPVTRTYYIAFPGPGQMRWQTPLRFPAGATVTITLAGGGSGITGTVYADAWQE